MKIRAAVVYKPNDPYVIEEVDLDEPREDEVLVKIVASGFCHTDHFISCGEITQIHPLVPGHEGSGIVVRAGERVSGFSPGDRVCMSFSYCNECHSCITGRPYECERNVQLNFGGRSYDGTTRLSKDGLELSNFFNQASFATYSVTHCNNLVHVPDDMDLRLAGPLGCGVQTGAGAVLNCLKPEPGSSIVIVGCGGVGMSALMAAKICGCKTIIAVDTIVSRLNLATELGATHVINAQTTDIVATVRDITGGKGAEYAVNASGSPETASIAVESTYLFGKIAVTVAGGSYNVLGSRIIFGITEGQSITSEFIPKLIGLYQDGLFPFDKLIDFYSFNDINKASADSLSGKTIKPVLLMEE